MHDYIIMTIVVLCLHKWSYIMSQTAHHSCPEATWIYHTTSEKGTSVKHKKQDTSPLV